MDLLSSFYVDPSICHLPTTYPVVPPDSETTMFRVSPPPGTVVCETEHARILQEAHVGHFLSSA